MTSYSMDMWATLYSSRCCLGVFYDKEEYQYCKIDNKLEKFSMKKPKYLKTPSTNKPVNNLEKTSEKPAKLSRPG